MEDSQRGGKTTKEGFWHRHKSGEGRLPSKTCEKGASENTLKFTVYYD